MRIKAVIFDLDGVLVNAAEWHFVALNRALGLFGFCVEREEHERFYNGLPTQMKLEHLSQQKSFPRQLHSSVHQLKQKYTQEAILSLCAEDFEKLDMLRRLKADGYQLAACSNAVSQAVRLMLQKAGISPFLEFFLSNEDVDQAKPDPEIYLQAFKKLNALPSECLIVEDSVHGRKAARASGGAVLEVSRYSEVNYPFVREGLRRHEAERT